MIIITVQILHVFGDYIGSSFYESTQKTITNQS